MGGDQGAGAGHGRRSDGAAAVCAEAQAAAAVHHPHVVAIHAVREVNGLPYIVMEYVAGGSLQDYLDRYGSPDWREAARLAADIASGLAAAHAQGLIHRDIKPSNILLQTEEESAGSWASPRLRRFRPGARRRRIPADADRIHYRHADVHGAGAGARREHSTARADLFSLGSVLYTLCTGRDPFPGGSPVAVLRHVCETEPTPIRKLNPDVPPWLAAVVEHLHAKRAEDRFASAAEVAELLRYNLEHADHPRVPPLSLRPPARAGIVHVS